MPEKKTATQPIKTFPRRLRKQQNVSGVVVLFVILTCNSSEYRSFSLKVCLYFVSRETKYKPSLPEGLAYHSLYIIKNCP
jgi:hypothetical protein